jgi:hypothetical protein
MNANDQGIFTILNISIIQAKEMPYFLHLIMNYRKHGI